MQDKPSPIRETDEEARRLGRRLLRGARYGSLAVIDAETGFPAVSRALLGMDLDGVPVILVSDLATHTAGLRKDPRCSIMTGDVGKGDPLAHARISVFCTAVPVDHDSADHSRIRDRFIARHRKAELYVDFADFRFFKLSPSSASLNGGFGKAYVLNGSDLMIANHSFAAEWLHLQKIVGNFTVEANAAARSMKLRETDEWRICGADMAGFDLIRGDILIRHEFDEAILSPDLILNRISNFSKTS